MTGTAWLLVYAGCLVMLAMSAVLIAVASYLGSRALVELRDLARQMAGPPPAAGPDDAPTQTLPGVPGVLAAAAYPLDARPPAAAPRPYLAAARPGRHRPEAGR